MNSTRVHSPPRTSGCGRRRRTAQRQSRATRPGIYLATCRPANPRRRQLTPHKCTRVAFPHLA
jgi:hypothetical protein